MDGSDVAADTQIRQLQQGDGGAAGEATVVGLDLRRMHVYVDGTQPRERRNAGPLYPSSAGWVGMHVIVDARIVTVIACNRTAITATVSPLNVSFDAMSVVAAGGGGAAREVKARAWLLDTAN